MVTFTDANSAAPPPHLVGCLLLIVVPGARGGRSGGDGGAGEGHVEDLDDFE